MSVDPTILALVGALRLADPVSLHLRDVECIADAVYWEARGEPLAAQIGVASTILNRGRPCEVIHEPHQFSFRAKKRRVRSEIRAWSQACEVAILTASGAVARYDSTHFHDTSASPRWTQGMTFLGQAGAMKFYQTNRSYK
jgi:spore germination cell wall hydrolase CwlJ-like protein